MAPAKKKKNVGRIYDMAISLPSGTVIPDTVRLLDFTVKTKIGSGGFGCIYSAEMNRSTTSSAGRNKIVAVKVEPDSNGPLFTEIHVYSRILREEQFETWRKKRETDHLGLPHFISSGLFTYQANHQLRFLVIPLFQCSLESVLELRQTLSLGEVVKLAKPLLDCLDYMHDKGYTHGDLKAGNIMFEGEKVDMMRPFLIDFGLTKMLPKQVVEKEDKKRAHNGTPHFTSCDAHRGCLPVFRSDLEILTHNMLKWLAGELPWEKFGDGRLSEIFEAKKQLIQNARLEVPKILVADSDSANLISSLYEISNKMAFDARLDLENISQILSEAEKKGLRSPQKTSKTLLIKSPKKKRVEKKATDRVIIEDNDEENKDDKVTTVSPSKSQAIKRKAIKAPHIASSPKRSQKMQQKHQLDASDVACSTPSNGAVRQSEEPPAGTSKPVQSVFAQRAATLVSSLPAPSIPSPSSVRAVRTRIPGTRNMKAKALRKSVIGRALKKH